MENLLSPVELRIVGSLIEKEITTPEYYPLTLNALVNACNQKSNRDPVMNLSEKEVENVLEDLKERRFVWQMNLANSRVPKYEHNLRSLFTLTDQEIAVICVLMLRGPQTVGELRTRTERMARFGSLEEVESVLKALAARDVPLTMELPRRPGQKESRFVQLFSEQVLFYEAPEEAPSSGIPEQTESPVRLSDRVAVLEQEVTELKQQIDELQGAFREFRRQFE